VDDEVRVWAACCGRIHPIKQTLGVVRFRQCMATVASLRGAGELNVTGSHQGLLGEEIGTMNVISLHSTCAFPAFDRLAICE
jgi:hypothetical protein